MKDAEARAYAEAALMHWGIEATPRLIKNRENAVFETVSPEFGRVALRLHRPGYQSDAAIRSELWWAEALVAAGVQVPLPVRTKAGDVIADVPEAGRRASIVTWMDGAPLGEGDVPLDGSPARQAALHHALGAELARIMRRATRRPCRRPLKGVCSIARPSWGMIPRGGGFGKIRRYRGRSARLF